MRNCVQRSFTSTTCPGTHNGFLKGELSPIPIQCIDQPPRNFPKMLEIFLENQYPHQINGSEYFLKCENKLTKYLELTYSRYM